MAVELRALSKREKAVLGKYRKKHLDQTYGLSVPIGDVDDRVSSPIVHLPLLARLERRGRISAEMCDAGERFHELFQKAALDGLRVPDLARIPAAAGQRSAEISTNSERCRRQIGDAIAALGGHGSAAASVIWSICGEECTVRAWSLQRGVNEEIGLGVLIAALDVLASHLANPRAKRARGRTAA